jgi:glycosyltransferase involved in cell wall biosynthesis
MNIGIFISRLTNAGPVNVIYNLIHGTTDNSIRYVIFTLRPELPTNTRMYDFNLLDVSVKCMYDKSILRIFYNIKRGLKSFNIDLIHAHCFRTLFFCSFFPIKKIFTVHQNFYCDWPMAYGILGRIMIIAENIMLMRWNKVICCAEYLQSILRKRIVNKNISHVRNGAIPDNIIERKGVDKKQITYIYVGSIDKRKNVEKLCKSFSLFSLQNEALLCLGSGEKYSDIKEMKLRNVEMLGFHDEVRSFMQKADYFISLSLSEGLPMAVIEALAAGLPVILSDIPSHKEFFLLNNEIGVLVKNDLDSALEKMRNRNYEEMSRQAYNTYSQYLTSEMMSNQYISYYKSLCK